MKPFVLLLCALLVAGCASPGRQMELRRAAQLNTELGVNYARQAQFQLASDKLNKAIDLDDSYAPAWSTLAVVQQTRGQMAAAEKSYRRALALDASDPVLKNNFGVFLCARGKRDEAQRLFAEVVRDPRYTAAHEAWTNAGICWLGKDANKAEQAFREALRLNPDSPDALLQLARLSYERRDYLRVRAFLQRYDLAQRATPELLDMAMRSEKALGDRSAALNYAKRLLQEFPESTEAAALSNWQP